MPKIELSHDSLARIVYDRVSTDDKMRLKVANFISTRYVYYEENNTLLGKDDLRYIGSYVDTLELTDAQRKFIRRSVWSTRKRSIASWTVAAAILILFIVLWNDARVWGEKESKARKELVHNQIELGKKIAYQAILLDSLRHKDSIQQELQQLANKQELDNKFTKAELEQAYKEMLILMKQLEKTNKQLEVAQKALEASLISEKAERKRIEKNYNNLNSRMSGQSSSQRLSRAAQKFISKEDASEADYQKAFQLARAAWDMDEDNSQAMDILNLIGHKKAPQNSGGFLSKDKPNVTYSRTQIKQIIQRVDSKKGYGTMKKTDLGKYLK